MQHLVVRAHGSGASRQSAAGRAPSRPVAVRRGGRARGGPCPVRRWLQRSVLRTDSPALLASGSCGATRCARCASSAQTGRRKSEVRSALRAPTPRLRCSAPQTSPHWAWPTPCATPTPHGDWPRRRPDRCRLPLRHRRQNSEPRRGRCSEVPQRLLQRRGSAAVGVPVRSREAQQHRRRAQRASSIILAATCLSGARAASAASFAAPAGAASIAGHPREAGASTGTRTAAGPRLCSRRHPEQRASRPPIGHGPAERQ